MLFSESPGPSLGPLLIRHHCQIKVVTNVWYHKRLLEPDKQPEAKRMGPHGESVDNVTGGSGRQPYMDYWDLLPPGDGPLPTQTHKVLVTPVVRPSTRSPPDWLGEGPKGSCH